MKNKGAPINELPREPEKDNEPKSYLDLSPTPANNYQLLNIDALNTEPYRNKYKNLSSLNISNNNIAKLELRYYESLDKIMASNNHIYSVELNLKKLTYLDLSQNSLKKIFPLTDCPSLRELYLSKNKISEIIVDNLKYVKSSLTVFDISENELNFTSVYHFIKFADEFCLAMKELLVLHICKNPFDSIPCFKEKYEDYLISKLHVIKTLNFQMVSDPAKRNKKLLGEKSKEKMLQKESEMGSITQKEKEVKKVEEQMTMRKLVYQLRILNQMGKFSDATMTRLEEIVEIYRKSSGKDSKDDDEPEFLKDNELDDFEEFLDLMEKIIDSVSEYEGRIYQLIASFGLMKNGKFASRAAACIKQRISSKNYNEIKSALGVIYYFLLEHEGNESDIPPKTIENLFYFLDETSFIAPMKKILIKLLEVEDIIIKPVLLSDGSDRLVENQLYCGLIRIFADALNYSDYIEQFCNNEKFVSNCINSLKKLFGFRDELFKSDQKLQQLKDILHIFKKLFYLSYEYEENFDKIRKNKYLDEETKNKKIGTNLKIYDNLVKLNQKIIASGIRELIEQKLRVFLQELFVPVNLADDPKELAKAKEDYKKKQICVSLIQCYGFMLSRSSDITKYLDSKSILSKIIDMLGQNEVVEPLLLHAACDFTYGIVLNKSINTDEKKFAVIANKLYNFRCLIPLLCPDSDEFQTICLMSEKYGQKAIERGRPIETKYLNTPIINQLIISINKLMSFIGRNSQNDTCIKKICKELSGEMKNLKRDQALAYCLLLPDEDVKLSVVECFFSFEVEKLTSDELASIYRQLSNLSSLSQKMQIIVSVIYLIVNKWFMFNLVNKEYKKVDACKEAITIANNLLFRNDISKMSGSFVKSKKKYLSAVLSMFLINVSCFKFTKKYFSDPKFCLQMASILQAEEKAGFLYTTSNFPIEIEKSHVGWSIGNVFETIDRGIINPYNFVSLRIAWHIGDVLLNKKYPYFNIDYGLNYESIIDGLGEEFESREIERIQCNTKTWQEEEEKYAQMKQNFKYYVMLGKEDIEIEQNKFVDNFNRFLDFVLIRCSDKQINEFSGLWDDKFYQGIDQIVYSILAEPKDQKDYGNRYEKEEEIVLDESNLDENCETDVFQKCTDLLREEDYEIPSVKDYGKDFNYIKGDVYFYNKYGLNGEINRNTLEGEETPNNPYIRSLFISAFLRALHAVLRYPAKMSIRNNLIKKIFESDYIRTISLLVESTMFYCCNTAPKYLSVMKIVFSNSSLFFEDRNKDEASFDFINKLGQLSYMMNKIIAVFRKDLTINNREHNILLSEICECSSIVMNQLRTLNFKEQKVGEVTMSSMINMSLINVILFIIKEFMNKDIWDKSAAKDEFNMQLLRNMSETSKVILGEYLSFCKVNKYAILESLTKSYVFDKCKMRKIFIKEVLDYSKLCEFKKFAPLGAKLILSCVVSIFSVEEQIEFSKYLVYISSYEIVFNDLPKMSVDEDEKKELKKRYRLKVEDISEVYTSNFVNKIWIRSKELNSEEIYEDKIYEILFPKRNSSKIFLYNLLEVNSRIKCYKNLVLFPSQDFLGKMKEKELQDKEKKEQNTKNAESNDIDIITDQGNDITPLNDKIKNKNNTLIDKNTINPDEDDVDEEQDNTFAPTADENCALILVKFKKDLLNSFKNGIFKIFGLCGNNLGENSIGSSYKLIVIKDNKLTIYSDKRDEDYNPFRFLVPYLKGNSETTIDITPRLKNYFIDVKSLDLKDINSIRLEGSNQLILKINKDDLILNLLDDESFIKFKLFVPVRDITEYS